MNLLSFNKPFRRKQSPRRQFSEPVLSQSEMDALAKELIQLAPQIGAAIEKSEAQKLGDLSSPYFGSGLAFEESRLYQPGDEVRKLDWRLMAKTGKAYTKLFEEEKQGQTLLLVDQRQAMRFGSQKRLKMTQAIRAAALFIWQAQQKNTPVTAMTFAKDLRFSETFEGSHAFNELMHFLSMPAEPYFSDKDPEGFNEVLKQALLILTEGRSAGTRLVLISDLSGFDEQSLGLLASLQAHALVELVWVQDPMELSVQSSSQLQIQHTSLTQQCKEDYAHWAADYFSLQQQRLQHINLRPVIFQSQQEMADLVNNLSEVADGR